MRGRRRRELALAVFSCESSQASNHTAGVGVVAAAKKRQQASASREKRHKQQYLVLEHGDACLSSGAGLAHDGLLFGLAAKVPKK